MVKEIVETSKRYECATCGRTWKIKDEADRCENQSDQRVNPLYGDDWKIGDFVLIFYKEGGVEILSLIEVEEEYRDGHALLPFLPEYRKKQQFQFLATLKRVQLQGLC